MNSLEREKVSVIARYAVSSFSEGDWLTLGQITGQTQVIDGHNRLLASMHFGDDDYDYCVVQVLGEIFDWAPQLIDEVIDHFDIDLWYLQTSPEKYQRIFTKYIGSSAEFWVDGFFRLFLSHLSDNKHRMAAMKVALADWGVSAFVAHEDIEPSREWIAEIEAGLETMDALVAVVQPGFKESDWCVQEVGYALGRRVDVIPVRAGLDPFGFFGKIQGVQAKNRYPQEVAADLVKLLLKKPNHRTKMFQSLSRGFAKLVSAKKIELIKQVDSWSIISDLQFKGLLEGSSLSQPERNALSELVDRVGAFVQQPVSVPDDDPVDDDLPF